MDGIVNSMRQTSSTNSAAHSLYFRRVLLRSEKDWSPGFALHLTTERLPAKFAVVICSCSSALTVTDIASDLHRIPIYA